MTLPGPAGVAWALGLLAWAAAAAVVGECARMLSARWVGAWRRLESVERLLLDFYLGGAAMYLVAALPIGAFVAPVVLGLPIAAAVLLIGILALLRARRGPAPVLPFASLARPASLVALASALALFGFELAVGLPVATGNTYDSSLLTLYVSLLLQHHTIPLSFDPYASVGLLYPQGTTVWLAWAQLSFGLPAARTSLLVTPLFFALAPLGGFVFGRRAFGSDRAAVAVAVTIAALGSWTRVLVGGSNDFVFAFPLVLLLAGQSFGWLRRAVPSVPDAVGFGILVGYSAAMNPVGAEWLLPTLLLVGLLAGSRAPGTAARWLGRWALAAVVSFVALLPTLYVLARGWNNPSLTPGAAAPPTGSFPGITGAQFVGSIDPYLFRPTDVWFSPIPFLRLELAILLTAGLGLVLLVPRSTAFGRYLGSFRAFAGAGIAVLLVLLAILWASSTGFGPATRFADISSAAELSIWLFTLYTLVAAIPLVLLVERAVATSRPAPAAEPASSPASGRTDPRLPPATVAVLLALVIVVPGVVLTTTELPPVLTELYRDFGNVTAGDFALLSYAGSHLPSGARVLIAPGSAAGFLPGYDADVVLLYPLVPGWQWVNGSYQLLVSQLRNATLNASGFDALAALDVGYIAITGWNTVLWPPFSPGPFLADPSGFPLLFHSGDAYLFGRTAS